MKLTLRITGNPDILPQKRTLAEAAGRGVSNIVKRHLVARDAKPAASALPRTGYWGDAASSVFTSLSGSSAVVTIPKEGAALHFYGGVVLPTAGHHALAIPKSAGTAGRRPAEIDPARERFALVWPKGSTTGTLRDRQTGLVAYLLVPKATIRPDRSVLPDDDDMRSAAVAAMESIL